MLKARPRGGGMTPWPGREGAGSRTLALSSGIGYLQRDSLAFRTCASRMCACRPPCRSRMSACRSSAFIMTSAGALSAQRHCCDIPPKAGSAHGPLLLEAPMEPPVVRLRSRFGAIVEESGVRGFLKVDEDLRIGGPSAPSPVQAYPGRYPRYACGQESLGWQRQEDDGQGDEEAQQAQLESDALEA